MMNCNSFISLVQKRQVILNWLRKQLWVFHGIKVGRRKLIFILGGRCDVKWFTSLFWFGHNGNYNVQEASTGKRIEVKHTNLIWKHCDFYFRFHFHSHNASFNLLILLIHYLQYNVYRFLRQVYRCFSEYFFQMRNVYGYYYFIW